MFGCFFFVLVPTFNDFYFSKLNNNIVINSNQNIDRSIDCCCLLLLIKFDVDDDDDDEQKWIC